MSKSKIFVLDTNVPLHDPNALHAFEEHTVVVPMTVVEELDHFKTEMDRERGRNARRTARMLDALREQGNLEAGVALESGGSLKVLTARREDIEGLPDDFRISDKPDNRILAVALRCRTQFKGATVILVTKDTNLRIKAGACGLQTEDYLNNRVDFDSIYTGLLQLTAPGEMVDAIFKGGLPAARIEELVLQKQGYPLCPHQAVLLVDETNPSHTGFGLYNAATRIIARLNGPFSKTQPWGIKAINLEQTLALHMLLNPEIPLVTLMGKAGTGKTLLAIAAGLHHVTDEATYTRCLVARPVFPMGRDLGFLPGDINEKLGPWMQPIYDNVDLLLSTHADPNGKKTRGHEELAAMGVLQIEALTYIRGRSIPKQYMIVDEAQNLTPHEVKTIITRAGQGTKIVLTGDPYQIDNPYVDASSNGLSYVVERFKNYDMAAHITLTKGERSPLAELASNIL